jgi:hypothetical protein
VLATGVLRAHPVTKEQRPDNEARSGREANLVGTEPQPVFLQLSACKVTLVTNHQPLPSVIWVECLGLGRGFGENLWFDGL